MQAFTPSTPSTGLAVDPASPKSTGQLARGHRAKLFQLRNCQSIIAGLLETGHDLRSVQAFAGHKTATATDQYRVSRLKELAEAVWTLDPRG